MQINIGVHNVGVYIYIYLKASFWKIFKPQTLLSVHVNIESGVNQTATANKIDNTKAKLEYIVLKGKNIASLQTHGHCKYLKRY